MDTGTPKVIKGPCCVCKDTRAERDECIRFFPEEECTEKIEKHFKCLKSFGFEGDAKKGQAKEAVIGHK